MNLDELQKECAEWAARMFPNRSADGRLHGMTEELGELAIEQLEQLVPFLHITRQLGLIAHHHAKEKAGIRGSSDFHIAKAKDAIGDITLFMLDYCTLRGWSLETIIKETWEEVKQRDWIEDPYMGLKRYKERTNPQGENNGSML
jgi:NTP pyrophosphatase (non-canonical NTP hydrolase)